MHGKLKRHITRKHKHVPEVEDALKQDENLLKYLRRQQKKRGHLHI